MGGQAVVTIRGNLSVKRGSLYVLPRAKADFVVDYGKDKRSIKGKN
jgi:hypothetical protein